MKVYRMYLSRPNEASSALEHHRPRMVKEFFKLSKISEPFKSEHLAASEAGFGINIRQNEAKPQIRISRPYSQERSQDRGCFG